MQRVFSAVPAALAACALMAACSSTPVKTADAPAPASPERQVAQVNTAPVADQSAEARRIAEIIHSLAEKSIYFDFDNDTVKPEYMGLLKHDFEVLHAEPKLSILLQGNADERGSSEYNLALGQKRAEAVRRALVLLGVPESQLEAVSLGKEKPRATCHEESCWAENRRVDLVGKP